MSKVLLVSWIILSSCQAVFSQRIENVRAQQAGDYITIYYEIVNATESQLFDVELYCSTNGGNSWGNPLENVKGDIGANIKAGNNKIIWDVLSDRNELVSNNVKFKVKARAGIKSIIGFSSFPLNKPEKNAKTVSFIDGDEIYLYFNDDTTQETIML